MAVSRTFLFFAFLVVGVLGPSFVGSAARAEEPRPASTTEAKEEPSAPPSKPAVPVAAPSRQPASSQPSAVPPPNDRAAKTPGDVAARSSQQATPSKVGSDAESSSTSSSAAPTNEPTDALVQHASALWTRALRIERLIAGHLDPSQDARALLKVDLADAEAIDAADLWQQVQQSSGERSRRRRAWRPSRKPPQLESTAPDDPAVARQRLLQALATWSRLPESDQRAALGHHEQRVAEYRQTDTEAEQLRSRVLALQREREQLAALLNGTLDVGVDPEPLLSLDLTEPHELFAANERRARLAAAWPETPPESKPNTESATVDTAPSPPTAKPDEDKTSESATPPTELATAASLAELGLDELRQRVAAAETELDRTRARVLVLSPAERAALLSRHLQRREQSQQQADAAEAEAKRQAAEQAAAEEAESVARRRIEQAQDAAATAAAQREAALEAARVAKSEARRIVAEDQARLLGVSEAQALFDAELAARRNTVTEEHDAALEQARHASELVASVEARRATTREADAIYEELREALTVARARLDRALSQIAARQSDVPELGGNPADPGGDVDRGELLALFDRVAREDERLRDLEANLAWDTAASYRDDIVLLNRARLAALEVTSPELEARVTGFGADGVRQAARELEQIALELRYQLLSLPRYGRELLADFEMSPVPVVWGVAQLVMTIVLWRWWRRRARAVIDGMQRRLAAVRIPTRWTRLAGTLLWYAARVRQPLELLAALWVLARIARELVDLSQLELLWLIAKWLLIGSAIVLWIDAIAARDTRHRGEQGQHRAKLRFRSLRLIGLNVVLVGLLLAMAELLVGRGAIYGWVITTCWVLAVPVAITLIGWWRKDVFASLEADPGDKVAKWVLSRRGGLTGFLMAGIGGGYLVGRGFARWVLRRAYSLDMTRRLLAYMFRREVAKQAVASGATERLTPVDDAVRRQLLAPVSPWVLPTIANRELEAAVELVALPDTTITAVVAERGMGKSSFLRRLAESVTDDAIVVECPVSGFPALLAELAKRLDAASPDTAGVWDALAKRGPTVVCIDDAQRVVRPVIGGLRGLDELGELARRVGSHVSWVFAMGAPAWQYVQRARGDRLFFDHVARLPPWNEEQIAALLRGRSAAANIEPDFEGLVVPRRYDATGEIPQDDRGEQGFYRILWDYADGNPQVACLFWAESLFRTASGRLVVRLFKEPSAAHLDTLALPIRFLLRSLVQLEVATIDELTQATQMTSAEAADALRYTVAHGYVEPRTTGYAVTWPWFRAVTNMLRRQHLLPS